MTDANHIIRTINRAEDAHYILTGMARHQSSGGDTLGVDTTPDPSVPFNLTMHDLATDIAGILRELALDLASTTGDWPDSLDTPGAALFIRQRAQHITGHEGHETSIELLTDRYRSATGVLGLLPKRSRMPDEPCDCGAEQWLYRERPPFVRCREGHVSELTTHLQSRGVEAITQMQAAWILDCTQGAISKWVKRGILGAGEKGGVTVDSIRARLAHQPVEC